MNVSFSHVCSVDRHVYLDKPLPHALPLGDAGIREIPNEAAVLDAMQSNIAKKNGLYFFPGFGLGPNPSREAQREAMKHMDEKLAATSFGSPVVSSRRLAPVRDGRHLPD